MSDTSFTKTVEDYSLDEDEEVGETSALLLANARKSVNLPGTVNAPKRAAPSTVAPVSNPKKKRGNGRVASNSVPSIPISLSTTRVTPTNVSTNGSAVNFLNSDKWGKDIRPPHLEDDDVFNALSVEGAAQHIMQWMTTKAMIASNQIKESKVRHRGGREKPDEEIKKIKVEAGEDDAMSTLHKQRFSYRTPLQEPKEYWHLVPLKWNEINKSVYLDHIGMDNICSPRCLELLHDRSSPLEIKMFLTLNISVGRAGVSKKQNLRTLDDGSTEVVCSDDWLSPTNISQLIEALDNLVAVWVVMWPGEWSMVALRRAVTKHLAFGDITSADLRKKMLEAFLNEVLLNNASFAARGKPPMEFEKIDKLAVKYLDNKRHFEKSFKVEEKTNDDEEEKFKKQKPLFKEVKELKWFVGDKKTTSGKDVCFYFNSSKGCRNKSCEMEHSCCFVKDQKLCGGRHAKPDHRNH